MSRHKDWRLVRPVLQDIQKFVFVYRVLYVQALRMVTKHGLARLGFLGFLGFLGYPPVPTI